MRRQVIFSAADKVGNIACGALLLSGLALNSALPARADDDTMEPSGPLNPPTATPRAPVEGGEPTGPDIDAEPKEFSQGPLFPYTLLDYALSDNVDGDGNVNYVALKDNKYLTWFLKAVATADLKQFPTFDIVENDPETGRPTKTRKDRTPELIFWINAYNAHILRAISQAYPINSIAEIKDFDTAVTHTVSGKNYSFKEMRRKIMEFGDPRVLFALTSGTAGGFLPSPTAVRYVEFDSRMNAAVSTFVNDPRNVTINRLQNVVTVNSMLKEVNDAFKKGGRNKYEGVRMVLAGYTKGNGKGYLSTGDYRIEFKDANSALNSKSARGSRS